MTTSNQEIRKEKIATLNELMQATSDSAAFYEDAARAVQNPSLRNLFGDIAESKKELVGNMAREIRAEAAEPVPEGSLRGGLRRLYSSVRAEMHKEDREYGYVRELEKSEDRLMEAFHDVIGREDSAKAVKQSLLNYLPKIQKHHDAMRDRKWVMQARQ